MSATKPVLGLQTLQTLAEIVPGDVDMSPQEFILLVKDLIFFRGSHHEWDPERRDLVETLFTKTFMWKEREDKMTLPDYIVQLAKTKYKDNSLNATRLALKAFKANLEIEVEEMNNRPWSYKLEGDFDKVFMLDPEQFFSLGYPKQPKTLPDYSYHEIPLALTVMNWIPKCMQLKYMGESGDEVSMPLFTGMYEFHNIGFFTTLNNKTCGIRIDGNSLLVLNIPDFENVLAALDHHFDLSSRIETCNAFFLVSVLLSQKRYMVIEGAWNSHGLITHFYTINNFYDGENEPFKWVDGADRILGPRVTKRICDAIGSYPSGLSKGIIDSNDKFVRAMGEDYDQVIGSQPRIDEGFTSPVCGQKRSRDEEEEDVDDDEHVAPTPKKIRVDSDSEDDHAHSA